MTKRRISGSQLRLGRSSDSLQPFRFHRSFPHGITKSLAVKRLRALAMGAYSSTVCSGFAPDSLFTEGNIASAPNLDGKISANRTKWQIYLGISEVPPNFTGHSEVKLVQIE